MFNIDISQLPSAANYFRHGGMLREHNYIHNKNGSGDFVKDCKERLGIIIDKNESLLNELFIKDFDEFQFRNDDREWHIDNDANLTWGPLGSSAIKKIFNATVKENVSILNGFLNRMVKNNCKIKIIFTLIPRYITMEEVQNEMEVMKHWKERFEKNIMIFCQRYNATFINYKTELKISTNHRFYSDIEHLNTSGAMALTSILNQDIKKLIKDV